MLAACEGERVRLLIAENALARASRVVQALAARLPDPPPEPAGTYTETRSHFLAAHCRLLIARGDGREAAAVLDAAARRLAADGMAYFAARARILQAIALDGDGDQAGALAALATALRYAQHNGLIRSFLDEGPRVLPLLQTLRANPDAHPEVTTGYLDDLLAAAGPSSAAARLSAREQDILAGLARGLSNKEIARTLQLAPETVKWHLKNIFLKLGVTSRLQAVHWARSHPPAAAAAGP